MISLYKNFPTEDDCMNLLEQTRWKGTPICPYCKSTHSTAISKKRRYHCNNCNTAFSVTVNTIFHHTHLPLQKWFLAISLILGAGKGNSARQLARDLEVNKNTAWYMAVRIQEAIMDSEQRELLQGINSQLDMTTLRELEV
jgi:transposase-like protein